MRNRVQGMDPDRRISRAALSLALLCVLFLTIWAGAPLGAAATSDEDSNAVERAATAIERQLDEISTAADLAQYARFQMGDGSLNGRRLLSAENLAMMHTPAIAAEGGRDLDHYAMGWRTGSIEGQPLISHDGNAFGFHASVALLPNIGGAVVVLMARNNGLSMVTGPESAGLEALAGGTPEVSRSSTVAGVVVDAVLALLVLGSIVSVILRRRRRREVPTRVPRRWPAILQVVAGVLIGASVVLLAASMSGGLDVIAFRILWALAPDVTILAIAIPLLLIAAAMATFWERGTTRQLLTPVSGSERSVEHV